MEIYSRYFCFFSSQVFGYHNGGGEVMLLAFSGLKACHLDIL